MLRFPTAAAFCAPFHLFGTTFPRKPLLLLFRLNLGLASSLELLVHGVDPRVIPLEQLGAARLELRMDQCHRQDEVMRAGAGGGEA